MNNASNFKWGLPRASNPQRVRKGSLIYWNDAKDKKVSNVPATFLEYSMTNASNILGGAFPLPATPKGWEKGDIYLWE